MKKHLIVVLAAFIFSAATTSHAHSLWINAVTSEAHPLPHTIVTFSWGHVLPIDDIPNSPNGQIVPKKFELPDPFLNKTVLLLHMSVMSVSRLRFCQKCSPKVSSGSTIFGSILATHIPRYNELPETTEPGTT